MGYWKYRRVFKVKSRVKTRQVREIWSQPLGQMHVPKSGEWKQLQVSRRVVQHLSLPICIRLRLLLMYQKWLQGLQSLLSRADTTNCHFGVEIFPFDLESLLLDQTAEIYCRCMFSPHQFNHTSWVAVVTPTDRPKSVRNRCVIELFCDVVYVVTLPFWHFCWCMGFCHMTESDLFLFLSSVLDPSMVVNTCIYIK